MHYFDGRPDLTHRPEPGQYVRVALPIAANNEYRNAYMLTENIRPGLVMGYSPDGNSIVIDYQTAKNKIGHREYVSVKDHTHGLSPVDPKSGGPFLGRADMVAVPITRFYFPRGTKAIGEMDDYFFKRIMDKELYWPDRIVVCPAEPVRPGMVVSALAGTVRGYLRRSRDGFIPAARPR